jgi:hypothetical protein
LKESAEKLWCDLRMAEETLSEWDYREFFARLRLGSDENYPVNMDLFLSEQDLWDTRSEELCEQVNDHKLKMDRAEELLEVIMHGIVVSAESFFVNEYDHMDEEDPFRDMAFKRRLTQVACAHYVCRDRKIECQTARAEFLASTDPTLSQERRELREYYQTTKQRVLASRENYEKCRDLFLRDSIPIVRERNGGSGLRGFLTEQNMAIMVPAVKEYRRSWRSPATNRDPATLRPTLGDSAYVLAPAQVSEQTRKLYASRRKFRRAERKFHEFVDNYNSERALQMSILFDLPESHFRDGYAAENGHTPEEREAELRAIMETAREEYEAVRQTIQDDLPTASEVSLAAQPSDVIEYAAGPQSWERRADGRVIDWQADAASEISAHGEGDLPSEPSSRYLGKSLGVGERIRSPSVKSNHTDGRKYKERRRKWLGRKAKYGLA